MVIAVCVCTAPGCGAQLTNLDLVSRPRHEAAVAVAVTGAAAPLGLFRPGAETAQAIAPVILIELELQNRSTQGQTLNLASLRLQATDVSGRHTTAGPFAAGTGTLPTTFGGGQGVGATALAPGARQVLWVAFGAFHGPRRSRLTELTLVVPGTAPTPVSLPLIARTEQGPGMLFREGPRIFALRTGLAGAGESDYVPQLEFEGLRAFGGWVLGASIVNGALVPRPLSETERRIGHIFAVGPRLGWLWRPSGAGLVASVVGGWGYRSALASVDSTASSQTDDFLVLSASAAVRFSVGEPVGLSGNIFPAEHRSPSPFRTFTVDVGYVHWFTRDQSLGGGIMMMFGGVLFSQ